MDTLVSMVVMSSILTTCNASNAASRYQTCTILTPDNYVLTAISNLHVTWTTKVIYTETRTCTSWCMLYIMQAWMAYIIVLLFVPRDML